jgi:hypothetical protein
VKDERDLIKRNRRNIPKSMPMAPS